MGERGVWYCRTHTLSLQHCWCIQLIIWSRGLRGKGGREGAVDLEEGTQHTSKFFEGPLRHPVLTPKAVGAALVKVYAVILPVEATIPLVDAPPDTGSEQGACNAWRDRRHYDHSSGDGSSILWAFISSLARLRQVEEASPGDPGRLLLSSMVVLIVTGEIPGPILHCGRCHTLDTGALDDLLCCVPSPDVSRKFLLVGNWFFPRFSAALYFPTSWKPISENSEIFRVLGNIKHVNKALGQLLCEIENEKSQIENRPFPIWQNRFRSGNKNYLMWDRKIGWVLLAGLAAYLCSQVQMPTADHVHFLYKRTSILVLWYNCTCRKLLLIVCVWRKRTFICSSCPYVGILLLLVLHGSTAVQGLGHAVTAVQGLVD